MTLNLQNYFSVIVFPHEILWNAGANLFHSLKIFLSSAILIADFILAISLLCAHREERGSNFDFLH